MIWDNEERTSRFRREVFKWRKFMSQRLTINLNDQPIYDIVYEQDFQNLAKELEPFGINERKLCVITDTRVKGF